MAGVGGGIEGKEGGGLQLLLLLSYEEMTEAAKQISRTECFINEVTVITSRYQIFND